MKLQVCQKEPILATWSNFEIGGVPKRAYFGYLEQFFCKWGKREPILATWSNFDIGGWRK